MDCILIKTSTGEMLEQRDLPELPGILAPQKDCQWYVMSDVAPAFNELTQYLVVSGYALNDRTATKQYTVTDYTTAELKARLVAMYSDAVQQKMDSFAQARGYDSMLSLCTYATSSNPRFAAEAQRGVDLRDQSWATCYQILADVENQLRPVPTAAEVLAELPAYVWPN